MMSWITFLATAGPLQGWRGDRMDWGGGGWLLMVLTMAVFWAVVIAFAVWAIRSTSHRHETVPGGRSDSAMDLARERYARGEISEEEFQRIKHGLS